MWMQPATQATNMVATVPPPLGGINAVDSLANMPETDAVSMLNWWPQPYGLATRKGYTAHASGMPDAVDSLAVYSAVDGNQKLFAWSNTGMYDVTTSGAVGAPIVTGLANSFWQSVQLVNSAGTHLLAVNGSGDNGIRYDAAGINRITVGTGAGQWSGLDPTKAIQLTVHQHRLWGVEINTTKGWYLPPDAIQGTFASFDFGPLFSRGGYLAFLTTWTIDDGNGAEDHLVAVSSEGEAAVYGGTDPSSDTQWKIVGVYYIGAPVSGRRSYVKVGGDLTILTQAGVVSMASQLLSTKVENPSISIKTTKIQFLISDLVATYSDLPGWTLNYFPAINMLLLNVPSVTSGGNMQFASNQIIPSEPWTTFLGMDAASWVGYNSVPMFGDYAGNVWTAWNGWADKADVTGAGGTTITAQVQQAFSYMNKPALQKQIGMYRGNFITSAPVTGASVIDYDFNLSPIGSPITAPPPASDSLWDAGLWDIAKWGGGVSNLAVWRMASGIGVAAAVRLAIEASGEILWVSTDYSYKTGGIL